MALRTWSESLSLSPGCSKCSVTVELWYHGHLLSSERTPPIFIVHNTGVSVAAASSAASVHSNVPSPSPNPSAASLPSFEGTLNAVLPQISRLIPVHGPLGTRHPVIVQGSGFMPGDFCCIGGKHAPTEVQYEGRALEIDVPEGEHLGFAPLTLFRLVNEGSWCEIPVGPWIGFHYTANPNQG